MNTEEIQKLVSDSVAAAIQPLRNELQTLKTGKKPESSQQQEEEGELSPAVDAWVKDKTENPLGGKTI